VTWANLTWQQVAVVGLICATLVGIAWAAAWGYRGGFEDCYEDEP
jgi:hypothetical protein